MRYLSGPRLTYSALFAMLTLLSGCQNQTSSNPTEEAAKASAPPKSAAMAFAWPFATADSMQTRGGTTRGSEVVLDLKEAANWQAIYKPGLTKKQQDRLAILSMAGDYRVSFQFVETAGFNNNYQPSRPYFSWGTEHIHVVEEKDDFISLQHILVMYFTDESGKVHGPMVMKHWRQDWTFEDQELHVFIGDRTWQRQSITAEAVMGKWTQAVYQVDDSPRYEVIGNWQHGERYSAWQSETSLRPLPRREFSVRDDYNILEGEHRITLTPNGWLHEQLNRKMHKPDIFGSTANYLAQEIGLNRYERIHSPSLGAAQDYWDKTQGYWQAVRDTWKQVYKDYDSFQLKASYDDRKLFEYHFGYAADIESAEHYDPTDGLKQAQDVIFSFIDSAKSEKG